MSFFSRARPAHAVLVSAAAALAFVAGYLTGHSDSSGVTLPPARTPTVQTGLAVLPFDTWSEDPDDDAFSDSLTREIITMLIREGVPVVPYAVVEPFKSEMVRHGSGREIPRIADRLGAGIVVLGTVRREAGGGPRVTINLFDGERGEVLSGIHVNWQGPRTGRRILREYVVPQIVEALNQ
jgi:TolB-like protein